MLNKNRVFEECKHGIWLSPCPICKEKSALSESEQQHLESSMKENKALMQELVEK